MSAHRIKLPDTRTGTTRKAACGGHEFYVTVSFYEDGIRAHQPGEVFIKIAKEGSTLGGLCDALAVTISLALQYGVPWPSLCKQYLHTRFEPNGSSLDGKEEFPSIVHAIARTVDDILAHRRSIWTDDDTHQRGEEVRQATGNGSANAGRTDVAASTSGSAMADAVQRTSSANGGVANTGSGFGIVSGGIPSALSDAPATKETAPSDSQ